MLGVSMQNFQIISKIGQGAYSSVHKVKRRSDGSYYAMKKIKLGNLSHKEIQNCLNEVRILASIQSCYVIGYRESFYDQLSNSLCMITQLAQNGDLMHRIKQSKRKGQYIEQQVIWKWIIQILFGLNTLHNMKIFHRDIKCANIFLGKNNQAMLGDLNVSCISKNGLAFTQTGTPYYASPEIWNDKPYNYKGDIWSFGCVIYQLAAGRPPFKAQDMGQLCRKINTGKYDKLPSRYSQDLNELINSCLKLNPKQRGSTQLLLKSSWIHKRIHLFPKQQFNKNTILQNESKLLKTIKPPKQYRLFKDILPRSNYNGQIRSRCYSQEGNYSARSQKNNNKPKVNIGKLQAMKRPISSKRHIKQLEELQNLNPNNQSLVRSISRQIKNDNSKQVRQKQKPPLPLSKKLINMR